MTSETDKQEIRLTNVELGRITHVGIVRVDFNLTWKDRPRQTTFHQPIAGYWELSVVGTVWRRANSTDIDEGGQIIGTVRQLRTKLSGDLCRAWDRWHLNGMRAGCFHQTIPEGWDGRDLNAVAPCPQTGYRYGHAWLVEVIPDNELDNLRELAARLTRLESDDDE